MSTTVNIDYAVLHRVLHQSEEAEDVWDIIDAIFLNAYPSTQRETVTAELDELKQQFLFPAIDTLSQRACGKRC